MSATTTAALSVSTPAATDLISGAWIRAMLEEHLRAPFVALKAGLVQRRQPAWLRRECEVRRRCCQRRQQNQQQYQRACDVRHVGARRRQNQARAELTPRGRVAPRRAARSTRPPARERRVHCILGCARNGSESARHGRRGHRSSRPSTGAPPDAQPSESPPRPASPAAPSPLRRVLARNTFTAMMGGRAAGSRALRWMRNASRARTLGVSSPGLLHARVFVGDRTRVPR